MRRLLIGLVTGAAVSVVASAALLPGTAQADQVLTVGPTAAGWWSAARPDSAVPAVAPPDVGAAELHVAGSNASTPLPSALPARVGPAAVAALAFDLPEGASVGGLRLRLSGTVPPLATVTACRALTPFSAEWAGAWADAPAYDCAEAGASRLGADGSLVVDGLERLRRGTLLAVVLVPGPLDRLVLAPPGPDALSLTVPRSAAPLRAGPEPPVEPARAAPGVPDLVAVVGLPGAPAPVAAGAVASGPDHAPAVAAPVTPARVAALAERPWPALTGTLLLALLAFVPMVRRRPAAAAGPERGVGRFRSERAGRAPDLT